MTWAIFTFMSPEAQMRFNTDAVFAIGLMTAVLLYLAVSLYRQAKEDRQMVREVFESTKLVLNIAKKYEAETAKQMAQKIEEGRQDIKGKIDEAETHLGQKIESVQQTLTSNPGSGSGVNLG